MLMTVVIKDAIKECTLLPLSGKVASTEKCIWKWRQSAFAVSVAGAQRTGNGSKQLHKVCDQRTWEYCQGRVPLECSFHRGCVRVAVKRVAENWLLAPVHSMACVFGNSVFLVLVVCRSVCMWCSLPLSLVLHSHLHTSIRAALYALVTSPSATVPLQS